LKEATVTKAGNTVRNVQILRASSSLALAAVALGLVLAGPSACSQPATVCAVTPGEGIARYTLVGTPQGSNCANTSLPWPGSQTPHIGGFAIGVEGYPANPSDPNGPNTPASMALQPEWIGARIEDAQLNAGMATYPYGAAGAPAPPPQGTSTAQPFAFGQFTTVTPDSSGICHVPDMVSDLTYPDIPTHTASTPINSPNIDPGNAAADGGPGIAEYVLACENVPDQPATTVSYKWSNVRTYVSAAADGAQTYASLTATQDGCTINYTVSIMVPRILCTGADGNADQTLCDPNPNAINPSGSGINTQISPTCENIGTDTAPDYECLPPAQDPLSQLQ
jgi:hypothetical protein